MDNQLSKNIEYRGEKKNSKPKKKIDFKKLKKNTVISLNEVAYKFLLNQQGNLKLHLRVLADLTRICSV